MSAVYCVHVLFKCILAFFNLQLSQGSVATHSRWGGSYYRYYYTHRPKTFHWESSRERIL